MLKALTVVLVGLKLLTRKLAALVAFKPLYRKNKGIFPKKFDPGFQVGRARLSMENHQRLYNFQHNICDYASIYGIIEAACRKLK